MIKEGLEPVVDDRSRILILGSLPGDSSLAQREYYANSRNEFWRILSCVYSQTIGTDYKAKLSFLSTHGIALWDVLKAAERHGSLDSNIKRSIVNDLDGFIRKHPGIKTIGFNGKKAQRDFNRHWRGHSIFSIGGMRMHPLPSSSPTPGKYVKSFKEKVQAWQEFLTWTS